MIVLHLAGVAIATVAILPFYIGALTDMVQAYFWPSEAASVRH